MASLRNLWCASDKLALLAWLIFYSYFGVLVYGYSYLVLYACISTFKPSGLVYYACYNYGYLVA